MLYLFTPTTKYHLLEANHFVFFFLSLFLYDRPFVSIVPHIQQIHKNASKQTQTTPKFASILHNRHNLLNYDLILFV